MLYFIELHYIQPLDAVNAQVEAHRAYLEAHFAAGHFLLAGPQVPREGGVILATGDTREQVAGWVAEDPFLLTQVAEARITAWEPGMRAAGMPATYAPQARVA